MSGEQRELFLKLRKIGKSFIEIKYLLHFFFLTGLNNPYVGLRSASILLFRRLKLRPRLLQLEKPKDDKFSTIWSFQCRCGRTLHQRPLIVEFARDIIIESKYVKHTQ